MLERLELHADRTILTILAPEDYPLLLNYINCNKKHHANWQPQYPKEYFTESAVIERIRLSNIAFVEKTALNIVALDKDRTKIIGVCNFTNIMRGVFQACFLGYSIDKHYEGKGYMFEILQLATDHCFKEYDLHRIMANYIPSNIRSGKLLSRLGFEKEGLAKSYLKIAGVWQDHILTAKLNPAHT